jgi:Porin subfamily
LLAVWCRILLHSGHRHLHQAGRYLRVDTTFNGGIYDAPFWSGDGGQDQQGNRFADRINSRARMALTIDTRTASEYGIVRTFGQADFQFSTYGGTVANASLNAAALTGSLTNDLPGGGYVAVENAFIQFAGFTLGKSASAYALPWNGYGGNNNTSFLLGGPDYVTGVYNVQYTMQFGNGVSATIGLDEGKVFNRTQLSNLDVFTLPAAYPTNGAAGQTNPFTLFQGGYGLGAAAGSVVNRTTGSPANAYGGQFYPDIAANIRVDQALGYLPTLRHRPLCQRVAQFPRHRDRRGRAGLLESVRCWCLYQLPGKRHHQHDSRPAVQLIYDRSP